MDPKPVPRGGGALLRIVGPGLLVAATGVGAGDLATAAFTGSELGLTVLWAVLVGAFLKYVLTEGIARWQLGTGSTLLEGALVHLPPARVLFPLYLLPWSWFVGSALISACGITAHTLLPLGMDAATGKIVYGALHSVAGLLLVWRGGYRLFERCMSLCIGIMFATVVTTAVLLRPDVGALLQGLVLPRIPDAEGEGLRWTVALMGGVGGTLTVLCYGYWIREEGRSSAGALRLCRLDLGVGYAMTALFGIAMVVIGSTVRVEGGGALLIAKLAAQLEGPLGAPGRWIFLGGAWCAVFSSLLGVWQSVPYLFADFWTTLRHRPSGAEGALTSTTPYRVYLVALALVPILGLSVQFRSIQLAYAVVGAAFLPLLACTLLLLNGRTRLVGRELGNHRITNVLLVLVLLVFAWAGIWSLRD